MPKAKLFSPESDTPYALSRSKVELFMDSAVDALLKTEFDTYRMKGEPHPLMVEAGLNAVPHEDANLAAWRNNFRGVRALHEASNLEVFGAIDDLWRDLDSGELMVAMPPGKSVTNGKWSSTSGCCGRMGNRCLVADGLFTAMAGATCPLSTASSNSLSSSFPTTAMTAGWKVH
jgi:hypothetical protein